jgi:hypothetical protein
VFRQVAARVVPSPAKRALGRSLERRFLATVGPPTRTFVSEYGLEVRGGPFAGMRYLPGLEERSGDLVAKLLGAYECELHGAVAELIAQAPTLLVDVGCAEGYYAVGFARALPGATIRAHDIADLAREQCAELARLNDVGERVEVAGFCSPAALAALPASGCVLFCDCEGYELTLLDPIAAPVLRGWWILVELHDFIEPGTTATLRERFAGSHDIELIPGSARDPGAYPELAGVDRRTAEALLSEHRPAPMQWALMRPRA